MCYRISKLYTREEILLCQHNRLSENISSETEHGFESHTRPGCQHHVMTSSCISPKMQTSTICITTAATQTHGADNPWYKWNTAVIWLPPSSDDAQKGEWTIMDVRSQCSERSVGLTGYNYRILYLTFSRYLTNYHVLHIQLVFKDRHRGNAPYSIPYYD